MPIDKKAIEKAIATLKAYKDGKRNLESRIVEEERWWKLRHWDMIRGQSSKAMTGQEARPEPTSQADLKSTSLGLRGRANAS